MAKQFQFFTKELMNASDRAAKKALSKFGAFVRQRAKSSIRKRKKISVPGAPPSSHTGKLKNAIFFGYEAGSRTVVVGPVLFSATNAPEKLEKGVGGYRARPFMLPAFQMELPNAPKLFKDTLNK